MNEPIRDERENLPSGSSALYDSLCPGRWRAQRDYEAANGAPIEIPAEEAGKEYDLDRDAEAGKRIHLLYAGKECPKATPAERDRAAAGRETDQLMYLKWMEVLGPMAETPVVEIRERRFWILADDGKTRRYSGQCDALWIKGHQGGPCHILLSDLKGLWGHHDDAALNLQIRRYIAIIAYTIKDLGYTEVVSASAYLNQPAVTMNPRMAMFDQDDLMLAVLEMLTDIDRMEDPNAERVPGEVQCHRCKAKLGCHEFQRTVSLVAFPNIQPVIDDKEMNLRIKGLDGPKLASLIGWSKAIETFSLMAIAEARQRLRADPAAVPGWELKPNSDRHPIADVGKIYNRLSAQYGVTAEEFTALCEMPKAAVETILRAKTDLKGKKLNELLQTICEGATKVQKIAPSLVQKG